MESNQGRKMSGGRRVLQYPTARMGELPTARKGCSPTAYFIIANRPRLRKAWRQLLCGKSVGGCLNQGIHVLCWVYPHGNFCFLVLINRRGTLDGSRRGKYCVCLRR